MSAYYRTFGLVRDPFLDTSDPYFHWETIDRLAAIPNPTVPSGFYQYIDERKSL